MKRFFNFSASLFCLSLFCSLTAISQTNKDIPVPESISIEKGLAPKQAEAMKQATLNFYAFWNTGKKEYLDKAISKDFFDNSLPEGRPQGPNGPVFASENFRKGVPDLRCEVKDVIISSSKVTVRMVFKGTNTGEFMGRKPTGKPIEFLAIDILHIKDGKIFEDWHIEDNLTLFKQLGIVK